MSNAGGGRNEVDPRFVSLYSVYNMSFPTKAVLFHVYTSISTAHLAPFVEQIRQLVTPLTNSSLELFDTSINELAPTPSKFHYIFNMRDLSRVYCGLCQT
ncbi:unnamed protein product, partial [Allacma fusca]